MRYGFVTVIAGLFAAVSPALADGTECQANLLSGRPSFYDAQTGNTIVYEPLPSVQTTGVYPDNVGFNLGAVPATATTPYQPIPSYGGVDGGYVPPTQPTYPTTPTQPSEPVLGTLMLTANSLGVERLELTATTVRLIGASTDFTFFNTRDQRPVDGPLTATMGSGVVNGMKVSGLSFSLGSGFNPTGTQGVSASFSNGARLETVVLRTPAEPPTVPMPATPSDILNGTSWALTQVNGQMIAGSATLTFNADGSGFGGRAQCNTFGGGFTAFTNFKINLSNIFATRVACAQLNEENAFFNALRSATDFRLGREGDTLALLNEAGASIALFERPGANPFPPSGSITGVWSVAGVRVNGQIETDSGFGMPSFRFENNGQFQAQLGCNTASGNYMANGLDFQFGPIAVTERLCIVPAPFEGPILEALTRITGLRNTAQGVSLVDGTGTAFILLTR